MSTLAASKETASTPNNSNLNALEIPVKADSEQSQPALRPATSFPEEKPTSSVSIEDELPLKPIKEVPQLKPDELFPMVVPKVQPPPKPPSKPKPTKVQQPESRLETKPKIEHLDDITLASPPTFVDKTGLSYDPVVADTQDNKTVIIIGVMIGVIVLLVITGLILFKRYHNRKARKLREQQKAFEKAARSQNDFCRPLPVNMSHNTMSNVSEMFSHPDVNTFHLQQILEEEAVEGENSVSVQKFRYSDNTHSYGGHEFYLQGKSYGNPVNDLNTGQQPHYQHDRA